MTIINWLYKPQQLPKNITHQDVIFVITKAAEMWNYAMKNLVSFQHGFGELQVELFFGTNIDLQKYPNRIAECRDKRGSWEIEFDSRSKWNKGSGWRNFLGIGNNLIAAALHEFGHVMDLPHSLDYTYVMHPEMPDVKKLSSYEINKYRNYFIQREKEYY